jgi:RNA recognition motif-containing protein
MKKLFVGNLAWRATEEELKQLFESAGGQVLSVKIVVDQYTGKSKGFGFVEMDSEESAQNAIRELNDKPYQERPLRVSLAQERPQGERTGGSFRSGGPRRERSDRGDRGERNFNRERY